MTASWYGPGFQGRSTANGEQFDQNQLTAASRTLPLGSRVLVTNLSNGKSVVVRINDRGPYVRGRQLDLSKAAARRLGMVRQGTARVRVTVLRPDSPTSHIAKTNSVERSSEYNLSSGPPLRKSLSYRGDISLAQTN